jgi:hypothetical protein
MMEHIGHGRIDGQPDVAIHAGKRRTCQQWGSRFGFRGVKDLATLADKSLKHCVLIQHRLKQ